MRFTAGDFDLILLHDLLRISQGERQKVISTTGCCNTFSRPSTLLAVMLSVLVSLAIFISIGPSYDLESS